MATPEFLFRSGTPRQPIRAPLSASFYGEFPPAQSLSRQMSRKPFLPDYEAFCAGGLNLVQTRPKRVIGGIKGLFIVSDMQDTLDAAVLRPAWGHYTGDRQWKGGGSRTSSGVNAGSLVVGERPQPRQSRGYARHPDLGRVDCAVHLINHEVPGLMTQSMRVLQQYPECRVYVRLTVLGYPSNARRIEMKPHTIYTA